MAADEANCATPVVPGLPQTEKSALAMRH
jgi:hypothetical protein